MKNRFVVSELVFKGIVSCLVGDYVCVDAR